MTKYVCAVRPFLGILSQKHFGKTLVLSGGFWHLKDKFSGNPNQSTLHTTEIHEQ